ncbi:hypothetical protein [Methylocella sp.]|uniref:hypothetical protein n=1 Tax=Methylocella sp. TaxID=1978226 RepID=UPI0037842C59
MNKLVDHGSFLGAGVERFSGSFERPVAPRASGGHLAAQFGGRLRRVFDLPAGDDVTQDRFDALLRQIGEKLG